VEGYEWAFQLHFWTYIMIAFSLSLSRSLSLSLSHSHTHTYIHTYTHTHSHTQQVEGYEWAFQLYFWTYMMIAFFILLNILLAILVDAYATVKPQPYSANRCHIHSQPTPYPLPTDALSTVNRRLIRPNAALSCQLPPYFWTYMMIAFFILLNFLLAILVDAYATVQPQPHPANRHPIHCQRTPYPLPTDTLSTSNRRP